MAWKTLGNLSAHEREVAAGQLELVRALIGEPWQWTREVYARLADGTPVPARDPDAVRFCLAGAVQRVVGREFAWGHEAIDALLDEALLRAGEKPNADPSGVQWYSVETFNNGRDHAAVLQLVDDALALAREEVAR